MIFELKHSILALNLFFFAKLLRRFCVLKLNAKCPIHQIIVPSGTYSAHRYYGTGIRRNTTELRKYSLISRGDHPGFGVVTFIMEPRPPFFASFVFYIVRNSVKVFVPEVIHYIYVSGLASHLSLLPRKASVPC